MKNEPLLAGEKVSVSRNGTVQWVSVHKIRATCATNMTSFPFDDQDCHLKYGSWVHNGWKINLSLVDKSEADTGSFVRNSEWDLLGVPAVRNEILYECCPESYLDITFTVKIRRRTLRYWRKVIIPSCFITSFAIFSLLLPPSSSSSRFLVIFLLFLLIFSTVPNDLPDTRCLLVDMFCWFYFILFCILVHSIIVSAVQSHSFLRKVFSNKDFFWPIASVSCCWETESTKELSEDEIRRGFARFLDTVALILSVILVILGIVNTFGKATHSFVY